MRRQAGMRAVRQAWVHGPRLVGRVQHFKEALVDHKRQSLATVFLFSAEGRPAALNVFGIGIFEACRRSDFMRVAVEFATFFVARHVQRKHHFGSKLPTLFQHRVDGVGIGFGMLGHGLEFVF